MPASTIEFAGRTINRVGYGAMQLSHGSTSPSNEEAVSLLRAAAELGVDHIDTAEFYGDGTVNRAIRDAFPDRASSPLIATKVGARHAPTSLTIAQKPFELRADVEQNLRSLGRERVDLVYLRRTDIGPGIISEGDQIVPLDDQLAELVAMRDEGKVGALGLGSVTADQLRAALPAGIVAVQNYYNLIDRDGDDVLAIARENDVAWVPFFPLGSGFPGRARVTEVPAVREAAEALSVAPAQVGLAWLLRHYERTVLIPGSGNLEHIRENLAAAEIELGDSLER
jgi:aryl-alcohol dehydrogenase-like predicted oxidoreductase